MSKNSKMPGLQFTLQPLPRTNAVSDYQRAVLAWHAIQVTKPWQTPPTASRERVIDLWFEGCEFRVESRPHASDRWDNRKRYWAKRFI
jgi:hypothetical protein